MQCWVEMHLLEYTYLASVTVTELTFNYHFCILAALGPLPTTVQGWKYVCTFTDYYTKFVDFYPIRSKSAECVAKCIKTFTCR